MRKRIVSLTLPLVVAAIFLSAHFVFAQNDSLTLTTYYPAPFGAYDTMQLVPKAPGFSETTPCRTGTMYVRSTGELRYC